MSSFAAERPPVDLTWENLVYTVQVPNPDHNVKTTVGKQLLKGVSGTARSGRTLAVMGPSGAGKSTFLNAVSGRLALNESQVLEGTAFLNDVIFSAKYKPLVSYVAQDDIVMGKDTPREALNFSVRIRSGVDAEEGARLTEEMIEKLSLGKCADTLLGIPGLIKGVSGGEKKRTNIGSELINNPMILLLDEPTTGLDSVNALRVGQLLRNLAHDEHRTVICTIHTPSSELYDVFDDILLLAEGHVIYHGPTKGAPAYFAQLGHPVPPRTNPSEYFMKLLQMKHEDLVPIAEAWLKHAGSAESKENLSIGNQPANVRVGDDKFDAVLKRNAVTPLTELALLTGRAWRVTMRDPAGTVGKLFQTLFFAVLLALFYANLDKSDNGVNDRAGVLFMQVMNLTFMNMMTALAVFPPERAVYLQEQANSAYSATGYYIAKVISELPLSVALPTIYVIITYFSWDLALTPEAFFNHLVAALCIGYCGNAFGLMAAAVFPRPEIAMTVTPVLIMPLMLVGGLFANTERLEPYWYWLNYISFPRYGYKALFVNEFNNIEDMCPSGNCRFTNGAEVKAYFGFDKEVVDTTWFNIIMLLVIMLILRCFGVLGLYMQGAGMRSRIVFEDNWREGKTGQPDSIELIEHERAPTPVPEQDEEVYDVTPAPVPVVEPEAVKPGEAPLGSTEPTVEE